jgi:Flp pilus assembly protein TadD
MKIDPESSTTQAILADVARREGNYPQALLLFNEVLRRLPTDAEALAGKSRTLEAMGQIAEALAALRAAVAISPAVPTLHLELSQLCSKSGDTECAVKEAAEFRRLRK